MWLKLYIKICEQLGGIICLTFTYHCYKQIFKYDNAYNNDK